MKDYGNYVKKVDQHLAVLRAKYLGQDTHFNAVLPPEANLWSYEKKADYLTQLILFSLAKVEPSSAILPELEETSHWLKAPILFLLHTCPENNHTFSAIKKILTAGEELREAIFKEARLEYSILKTPIPFLLQSFDEAILYLLHNHHLSPKIRQFYK